MAIKDLKLLPQATEIAGVEWYAGPSETPMEFSATTGSPCGVLMLWTRAR